MPCRVVEIYRRFGWKCCLHLANHLCEWRQDVPPKWHGTPTRPHDATSQSRVIHSHCRGNFNSPFLLTHFPEYIAPNWWVMRKDGERWGFCLIWAPLRNLSPWAHGNHQSQRLLVGSRFGGVSFLTSTSVSPANLHSTNCSTITLIYHLGLVQ
jgi:hypothetical protein